VTRRKRVLFFAEPATLAHVVRPAVLAAALSRHGYDVQIATGHDFEKLAAESGLVVRTLDCIGTNAYLSAVRASRVVFPLEVLERYVDDDRRHISDFKPDLVVGDFRLSLSVSARLASVPYVCVSNAYWSPYVAARTEIPAHWSTRLLGPGFAGALFRPIAPLILGLHALPMRRLRARHGLPSIGLDLRRVFTEGDITVFADVPDIVPGADDDGGQPQRYAYIGAVPWSPVADVPRELLALADKQRLVYVSLGSSGNPALLSPIAQAVADAGCVPIVATGRASDGERRMPGNGIACPFLPGDKMARLARVVICNGGSPSTQQAFAEGTPVLGIPGNLDQLLNMQFVVRSGSGLAIRADQVDRRRVASHLARVVEEPSFAANAGRAAAALARYDAGERFAAVVRRLLRDA